MDAKAARRMARFAQFAVAAAGEAIRDSGLNLDTIDRTRIAVDIGTSLGGTARGMKRASARGSVLRSWERGISGIASQASRCFREQYVFQRSCGLKPSLST